MHGAGAAQEFLPDLSAGPAPTAHPLLLGLWARLRHRPVRRGPYRGTYSIILAAHNEERHMLRQHGEAYAAYLARTGRFVPRMR